MANRSFVSNALGLEKKLVTLFGTVNIGVTGAPTLQADVRGPGAPALAAAAAGGFNGIKSITRLGAGQYKVTLQDAYRRLLSFWGGSISDAAPAATTIHAQATGTDVTKQTGGEITFICRNNAGAATDPANGEKLFLEIELSDSSAP